MPPALVASVVAVMSDFGSQHLVRRCERDEVKVATLVCLDPIDDSSDQFVANRGNCKHVIGPHPLPRGDSHDVLDMRLACSVDSPTHSSTDPEIDVDDRLVRA